MTERKGFTLIELLVVVAIISLLVAIMSPSLLQIVKLAKRAVCSTRLEDIGGAAIGYASSNDESLPFRADGSTIWTYVGRSHMAYRPPTTSSLCNSRVWYMLVVEGMLSPADFVCPADPTGSGIVADGGAYDFDPGDRSFRPLSYGLQISLSSHTTSYVPNNPKMCKAVTLMHNTALAIAADSSGRAVTDANDTPRYGLTKWSHAGYWKIDRNPAVALNPNNADLMNSPNHDGKGQNVLYLDRHISWEESPYCGIDGDLIYARDGATNSNFKVNFDRPAHKDDSAM